MDYEVPSADDLPKPDRTILIGGEDYLLKVLNVTEEQKKEYKSETTVPKLVFKFTAESFADGGELQDVDGQPVPAGEVWLWTDVDLRKLGFMTNGTPALGRQLLLALNGITDPNQRVPKGNAADLVGQKVIAHVVVRPDGSANKITGFKSLVGGRRRGAGPVSSPVLAEPPPPSDTDFRDVTARVMASGGAPDAADLAAMQAYMDA